MRWPRHRDPKNPTWPPFCPVQAGQKALCTTCIKNLKPARLNLCINSLLLCVFFISRQVRAGMSGAAPRGPGRPGPVAQRGAAPSNFVGKTVNKWLERGRRKVTTLATFWGPAAAASLMMTATELVVTMGAILSGGPCSWRTRRRGVIAAAPCPLLAGAAAGPCRPSVLRNAGRVSQWEQGAWRAGPGKGLGRPDRPGRIATEASR